MSTTPPPTAADHLTSEQAFDDLRTLNARFIDNFVRNDVAAHDTLLHPSFTAIQSDGSVLDRTAYLRGWATGFDPDLIPRWETRGEWITVVGPVGLVRATNVFTLVRDGRKTQHATLYTDTYLYEGGRWLCLQAQTTPVRSAHVAAADSVVSVHLRGHRQP